MTVRTSPRPPFETAPLRGGHRVCPMCGELSPSKRGWWHRECAELFRYAAFPGSALALLVKAHGRACWRCGQKGFVELEHIRPLWSLNAEERREFRWWMPFNLQLLCRTCHRAKTAREARERADLVARDRERVLAQRSGITVPGLTA